jgi:hypothetical protein
MSDEMRRLSEQIRSVKNLSGDLIEYCTPHYKGQSIYLQLYPFGNPRLDAFVKNKMA